MRLSRRIRSFFICGRFNPDRRRGQLLFLRYCDEPVLQEAQRGIVDMLLQQGNGVSGVLLESDGEIAVLLLTMKI